MAFLSLVAASRSPLVKVTAYEANEYSAQLARKTVKQCGLQRQITIVTGDALSKAIAPRSIDLLMTETFDCGMRNEIGHRLLEHFLAAVRKTGYVVPESVELLVSTLDT